MHTTSCLPPAATIDLPYVGPTLVEGPLDIEPEGDDFALVYGTVAGVDTVVSAGTLAECASFVAAHPMVPAHPALF